MKIFKKASSFSNMKKLLSAVAVVICIVAAFFLKHYMDNETFESRNSIKLDTSKGMSVKDRTNDFNELCTYLEKNVPMIYDYEELYGIRFENVKDYYFELVENTENDYEYYALVQGLINNIPSGHMTLGYPNAEYVSYPYTYRINDYANFNSVCDYWEHQLMEECRKHYNEDYYILPYYYVNGEYIQSEHFSLNGSDNYAGSRLVSVDNVPIDDFIKLCPLEYKIKYDHQNNKVFRETILFNSICGIECTIQYEDKSGNLISEKMYYGTSGSIVLNYVDYFYSIDYPEKTNTISEESNNAYIYTYYDNENDIMYIKFNDFTYGGAEVLKEFDKTDIPDNIIIDLRDNTGGMVSICDSLIEKLSDKDIEYKAEVYITPDSNYDRSGYTVQKAENLPFETKFKQLYTNIRMESFEGESERPYNIYVLVSYYTLSAADRFVSVIKDNNLGTIIGAFNTGGEAYGSPDLKVLERSGIYFYYTENKSLNSDGTDNSVYGTSPDIYVNISKETLDKRDELIEQGIDYSIYESRIKWDSVLIETLEIIKEK